MLHKVFIGYDSREAVASHVAAHSIIRHTCSGVMTNYLKHRELRRDGFFRRPWLIRPHDGEFIDLVDGKPFSTEFSHTRFLVPALSFYHGWSLFMDADMIFTDDIKKLFDLRDDKYAVMCVPHTHNVVEDSIKMDHRLQQNYRRKNWSSFVLWNCAHPANRAVTEDYVNTASGAEMHSFSWLSDDQIGFLPFTYNYIHGVSPDIGGARPSVLHLTNGGPWFDDYSEKNPYASLWEYEYEDWKRKGEPRD